MNILDVLESYSGAHQTIRPMDFERDTEYYSSKENLDIMIQKIEEAGGDRKNLLVTDAQMNNIYYAETNNGVYIEVFPFVPEYLEMIRFKDCLRVRREEQKKLISKGEYEVYYFYIANAMKIYDFEKNYKDFPEDRVSNIWADIYMQLDYGFSAWNPEVIQYVMARSKRKPGKNLVRIYRGEGTKSTPVKKAYSWTTNINIALWFACMGQGMRVWQADVKQEDIAFFISGRDEDEVVVAPKKIQNLKSLDMYEADRDTLINFVYNVMDDYRKYGQYIPELYRSSEEWSEIHAGAHAARVLLNSLLIANEYFNNHSMDMRDFDIIAAAAVLYDCKRRNDCEDAEHGYFSAERMKDIPWVQDKFNADEQDMIYTAVKYHSLPDSQSIDYIERKYGKKAEKMTVIYQILKDADTLDRYRLDGYKTEFDFNDLRLEESKSLTLITAAASRQKVEELVLK